MKRVSLGPCVVALTLAGSGLALPAGAAKPRAPQTTQNTLQIPGFPALPLGPDARVLGPNGPNFDPPYLDGENRDDARLAPYGEGARTPLEGLGPQSAHKPKTPSAAQSETDPDVLRQGLLDTLFQRLRKSSDDEEAEGVAGAIERVWFDSGSDTADLLMGRALLAEHAKKYRLGREILGKIVEIEPGWAEAWNELAITRVLSDDPDGAMEDLAHALALEPRHFGALTGVGALLLESGDKKGALRVFRRVLDLYPRLGPVRSIVDRLTIQVEGRDL